MCSTDKYNIWFTITIEHEYYNIQNCPVMLYAQPETANLLNKYGILCRKNEKNKWIFLIPSCNLDEKEIDNLYFDLIPQRDVLHCVTEVPEKESVMQGCAMRKSADAGKWIEIKVPFRQKMADVVISLNSKAKYWEFIMINRLEQKDLKLKIEEKLKNIIFSDYEQLQYLPLRNTFRIKTSNKIKMKEVYDYKLHLFELKDIGESVLCNNLPIPKPEEKSILSPDDTITTYFYL